MPTLALIGRPNVGKSTLFNALVGKRLALVHDRPGVTRDWRTAEADLFGDALTIMDTAGVETGAADAMATAMREGTLEALERADVALLLIDGRAGVTAADADLAALARRSKTPVLLGVTKAETPRAVAATMAEAHGLGLGEPIALSAPHGLGLDDLHAALGPYLAGQDDPPLEEEEGDDRPIKLAIVGRPNVGKSTLLNALLGRARALTGPEAGVTRDAIEVPWRAEGREFRLVDTAGLRRRTRVDDALERMAGAEAHRAIRLAQAVAVVVDATAGLERQDIAIAGHALDEGRATVLVANKWDAVPDRAAALEALRDRLSRSLGQIGAELPIVGLSALTGARVRALAPAVVQAYTRWNVRVGTGPLNRWLAGQVARKPPPRAPGGRANKAKYMTQVAARPPRFVLWVAYPDAVPESWLRYLAAALRRDFGMGGVPVRVDVRTSDNPYAS
jgi:GTPase